MTESQTNSPRKWSEAAIVVLTALTAFMTAYHEFGAPDARQDAAIAALVRLSCYESPRREKACKVEGLIE